MTSIRQSLHHTNQDGHPPFSAGELQQWTEQITAHPYRNYLYSYPHKTAYREFASPFL